MTTRSELVEVTAALNGWRAIESAFATVKLRTRVTKGAGSKTTTVTMAFKLLQECEKRWHRLRGYGELKNLREGVAYENGIVIAKQKLQRDAAS